MCQRFRCSIRRRSSHSACVRGLGAVRTSRGRSSHSACVRGSGAVRTSRGKVVPQCMHCCVCSTNILPSQPLELRSSRPSLDPQYYVTHNKMFSSSYTCEWTVWDAAIDPDNKVCVCIIGRLIRGARRRVIVNRSIIKLTLSILSVIKLTRSILDT